MISLCSPSKFIELKTPGPNYEPTTETPKNTDDPIFIEEKKETTPFFAYWFSKTDPNEVINDDEIFWFTGEAIEGDYFRTERSLNEYLGLETSPDDSPLPSALSPEAESPTLSPAWNNLPEPDWEDLPLEPLMRHRSSLSHHRVAGESPLKRSAAFSSLESVPWGESSPNWNILPLSPLSENDNWFDEKDPDWDVLPLPSLTETRESTISEPQVEADTNKSDEFEISRPTSPASPVEELLELPVVRNSFFPQLTLLPSNTTASGAAAFSQPIFTNNQHNYASQPTCTDVVPYTGPKNQGWNGSAEQGYQLVDQSGAAPRNQVQSFNMSDFTLVNNGNQQMYIYNKPAFVSMNLVGDTYMTTLRYQGFMRGEDGFWVPIIIPLQAAMAEDQFSFPNPVFPQAQSFIKDEHNSFQNHVFL